MLNRSQAPATTPQAPGGTPVNAPAAFFPAQIHEMDVGALRSQVQQLQVQLSGLQAQWDGLYSQLNNMLKNNPARPGVQQEWANVGVQIARVKGDIAYREAQIALSEGRSAGTTTQPDFPPFRSINPDIAFPAAAMLFAVLGLPVSIAWARRILRGRPQPAGPSNDHTMRLERMETAIDAVAIEIERISEGQRFVTRILMERPERAGAAESAVSPASAAPAPRALGAGPMEPISIPQRERVHEPIVKPR